MGLKKKLKTNPGRVRILSKKSETRPEYDPVKNEITQKTLVYI